MCLHLKLLDIDHPLTFEASKLRQIEAHALIYLSHYKGLVSSANPNVNEHEVREVAVIFKIYALVKPNLPLMTSYHRFYSMKYVVTALFIN